MSLPINTFNVPPIGTCIHWSEYLDLLPQEQQQALEEAEHPSTYGDALLTIIAASPMLEMAQSILTPEQYTTLQEFVQTNEVIGIAVYG